MNYKDVNEEDLPNYKIFWVDDKHNKHIVTKFKAKDDNEAKTRLNEYCNALNDSAYYYGRIHYVKYCSPNGDTKIKCMDDKDIFLVDDDYKQNAFIKAFKSIGDFFEYWFLQKPLDWWYKMQDVAYLLKYGEARSNQWNLDCHLLDTIELNVPSLIKYSHGMMFIDEAILELHKNDKNFDLRKYHEEHCRGYPDDVEKLAMKIQNDEYNKLLLYVKLYKYYSDFGCVDLSNANDVKFDKEWRHTLPIKDGTYDEFDYDKLNNLAQEQWNNIWDWVKKHGQKLYD